MFSKQSMALNHLRQAIGNPKAAFQDGQWEAIEALLARKRMLVVQRTGWGKSMVYFLATRLLRDQGAGPSLLISPLLALMRNQIDAARRIGIRAETINSTNQDEWESVRAALHQGRVDILLISPEKLANDDFLRDCLLPVAANIGLLVVDEAHCISDWGHDFRPDYQRIVRVLRHLPANVPVLTTTATANRRVVEDIQQQLGENLGIMTGPLVRQSLCLQNIALPDKAARLAWLAENLPRIDGSGIVYALTIRDAKLVARWLQQQGIEAWAYYGELDKEEGEGVRVNLEERLINNDLKALVATSALGMGFDKPDLGFVVHYQMPQSVIHYYQQVGRAGRALDSALGILLSGREDAEINHYFIRQAFPNEQHIREVVDVLAESDEPLTIRQIEQRVNLRQGQIKKVLGILAVQDAAPVAKDGSRWLRTPNPLHIDHEKIARLTKRRKQEWGQMQQYLHTRHCLMLYLAEALDDRPPQPCGRCVNCLGQPLLSEYIDPDLAQAAVEFLRHSEMELPPAKQWATGAFMVYGWRGNIHPNFRNEAGRILSHWGEVGWGERVQAGKDAGQFDDTLVMAAAEMIRERWRPQPEPRWVTCVPSLNNRNLVPDYASRLADALGLPFIPCVSKIRDNEPQKYQQNRFHQAQNLDGVFAVDPATVIQEPVLLVDDMVDSGWTLTVIGQLLREAGAGPVFPLALASTATS